MNFIWQFFAGEIVSACYFLAKISFCSVSVYTFYLCCRKVKKQTFDDLTKGVWITGLPGTGKSTLARYKAIEIARQGKGFLWVDIHGQEPKKIIRSLPEDRLDDVIYINPYNEHIVGFNLLQLKDGDSSTIRDLVADDVTRIFSQLYGTNAFGAVQEDIIYYSIQSLVEWAQKTKNKITLLDLVTFFNDDDFKDDVLSKISNPVTYSFWQSFVFDIKKNKSLQTVKSKILRPMASELLFYFVSQKEGLDLDEAISKGKIVIFDLDQNMGEKTTRLIAGIIINKIKQVIMRRDIDKSDYYFIFLDEFVDYLKGTRGTIEKFMGQLRKYKVGIFLINQNIEQIKEESTKQAVRMCSTKHIFRVNRKDAVETVKLIEEEEITEKRLTSLPDFICLNLELINHKMQKPTVTKAPLPCKEYDERGKYVLKRTEEYGKTKDQIMSEFYGFDVNHDVGDTFVDIDVDVDLEDKSNENPGELVIKEGGLK